MINEEMPKAKLFRKMGKKPADKITKKLREKYPNRWETKLACPEIAYLSDDTRQEIQELYEEVSDAMVDLEQLMYDTQDRVSELSDGKLDISQAYDYRVF